MTSKRKKRKKRGKTASRAARPEAKKRKRAPADLTPDLSRLEFFRHGVALVPDPEDRAPGVAIFLRGEKNRPDEIRCTCSVGKKRATCSHIKKTISLYKKMRKYLGEQPPEQAFRSSLWYRLAALLAKDCPETPGSVRIEFVQQSAGRVIKVVDSSKEEMLRYISPGADSQRFVERLRPTKLKKDVPNRAALLRELARLTMTHDEHIFNKKGFRSYRQEVEESFWYRLAYHAYREFGSRESTFQPAVEDKTGLFTITCSTSHQSPVFRLVVPRLKVEALLAILEEYLPNQHGLKIHPIPLKSLFKVSMNTKLDLEVRPVIQLMQEQGEKRFLDQKELERYRYGNLVYIKEMGILARLEQTDKMRRFKAPEKMVLKESQIPHFLQEFGEELSEGPHLVEEAVRRLKIFNRYDRVEVSPEAIERDWCWLSVAYGFGNTSVSLSEILRAKKEGQRYISIPAGWVDCRAAAFTALNHLGQGQTEPPPEREDRIKLSGMNLFRLQAACSKPLVVQGNPEGAAWLKRLLSLKPPGELPELKGLRSTLRHYQKLGTEWLWFLFENGLGGLLCDEMGLGKTHEVMALMLLLRDQEKVEEPFLVVCPTTVLSHWRNKIREHAPGLRAGIFHGGDRDLEQGLQNHDVLLTTYGILRNDIDQLQKTRFALVIFDEIQHIKNPETLSYRAASKLNTRISVGLTGTPIENRLSELKALLDLTVPGYLGSDREFADRYIRAEDEAPDGQARKDLHRLISPFTLRRLKKTVLKELPEKIEDIRTCRLSDDQIKLYRDAIASRGKGFKESLKNKKTRVPYMHIFALLSLLKQICDHPALVEGRLDSYDRYQSGKWDLFKELIDEILDSGQKVVVYSQYVGMVRIIEMHLKSLQVGLVTLTGSSRKRGEIVDRFNNDPDCRVFVGSLKAGGIGIDLLAASVVIHYDRWWNAAREDQATDRVHRIGQTRGVQVFKLVTEGTLEERISAIIVKKRDLMDSIVQEDDPGLLKTFSREELLRMLSPPEESLDPVK